MCFLGCMVLAESVSSLETGGKTKSSVVVSCNGFVRVVDCLGDVFGLSWSQTAGT